jgi:hypothetical protein
LFFFTGIHEDYHGTGDEAERISYNRLARVVKLVADTVALAAEMSPSPASTVYVDWPGLAVDGIAVGPMNLRPLLTRIGAGVRVEPTGIREGEPLELPPTLGRRP